MRLFSFRKKRYAQKKDYCTCCTEKKARSAADGPSPTRKVMRLMSLCFPLRDCCLPQAADEGAVKHSPRRTESNRIRRPILSPKS